MPLNNQTPKALQVGYFLQYSNRTIQQILQMVTQDPFHPPTAETDTLGHVLANLLHCNELQDRNCFFVVALFFPQIKKEKEGE